MEINVEPGDLLVIATDGISKRVTRKTRTSVQSLRNCVVSNATAPLSQLAANVLAVVAKWGKQQDDQTLLIVRCISNA